MTMSISDNHDRKNLLNIMDDREPVGAQKRDSIIESNGKPVAKKLRRSY